MKISIFTTMTNPKKRMDPFEEALECYSDFADEVIRVGDSWPEEFSFDYIGKTFQEGFDKCSGDWVIRMDIDTFFHEKNIEDLKNILLKNENSPGIVFPKYQIFTPDRFNVKAKMCIAFNKKLFPSIKLNGGGDLCDPTINGKILDQYNLPNEKIPIWNYDSVFKTKEVISKDRARFARAWKNYFGDWGDRGGGTELEAFDAWFKMIEERYSKHTLRLKIKDHPKYIIKKLLELEESQFGFDAFGLKGNIKRDRVSYFKNYLNYLTL